MPLTDSYGQQIPYPTLTDKPNAQTLGQGIVEGLTPKTVMSFKSASVRGATITAPREGMLTWLEDLNRLEAYDGASWVVLAAGTAGWSNVPFNTAGGWGTYDADDRNNNQGRFQYRVVYEYGQRSIKFRGGIGRASGTTYTPASPYRLTTSALPSEAWPDRLRTIVVPCSDVRSERITLKLDIRTDGHLDLYGIQTGSTPPWVGFNGVSCAL
ncbi:hypothetical protein [Streptomyces sp. NPDC050145]|uniref:hypothetical protein n=1 Tax=Streptomyces sp. NPDC050145 TaxID=3365602 RepID=UPI003797ADD4